MIAAYGSIIQYLKFSIPTLRNDPILVELFTIANLPKVDPVLLTSICNLFHQILNNADIKDDPS